MAVSGRIAPCAGGRRVSLDLRAPAAIPEMALTMILLPLIQTAASLFPSVTPPVSPIPPGEVSSIAAHPVVVVYHEDLALRDRLLRGLDV